MSSRYQVYRCSTYTTSQTLRFFDIKPLDDCEMTQSRVHRYPAAADAQGKSAFFCYFGIQSQPIAQVCL